MICTLLAGGSIPRLWRMQDIFKGLSGTGFGKLRSERGYSQESFRRCLRAAQNLHGLGRTRREKRHTQDHLHNLPNAEDHPIRAVRRNAVGKTTLLSFW